jgi:3-dehydroquinate dehydratase-1
MKNNYCLPIIKHSQSEVFGTIKKLPDYEYYEIWLDYITDIDHEFIAKLIEIYRGKLIFVFRRKNLETTVMKHESRLSLISLLEKTDSFIDLDIITQQEELSYIGDNMLQIPIITSYHNYQTTPDDKKLVEIIVLMLRYTPQIIKVATHCQTPKDGMRLLDLLISLKSEQKKYIILGMGEYGTITRVYGSLWGNEMIFAPDKQVDASAPGQFTRKEYEELFKILQPKH